MGCIKLHILDEQYKSTELKVSYINEKLTPNFCAENLRSGMLINRIDPTGMDWIEDKMEPVNIITIGHDGMVHGAFCSVKGNGFRSISEFGSRKDLLSGKTKINSLVKNISNKKAVSYEIFSLFYIRFNDATFSCRQGKKDIFPKLETNS
jgi:hypothetical protein